MEKILPRLQELEPDASFSGSPPRITSTSGRVYFVKVGSPRERAQYEGERASLEAINEAADGLAPRVLSFGVLNSGSPYFISEYKDLGSLTKPAASRLAERMAIELHKKVSPNGFGFGIPTYCGVTRFQNGWFSTWHQCYASMIQDLLTQLQGKSGQSILLQKGKRILDEVIPKLLGEVTRGISSGVANCIYEQGHLDIDPVILHGDLWSGNVGVDGQQRPIIFDPASYYGHNEADLSIARIFGGFPDSFFEVYHQHFPKTEPEGQYNLRMELYELFHYLNHTLIFGGHYARSAERKMDILIDALKDL